MKRFILVTFGFLGWVFYEMSGGANFAPRPEYAQLDPEPVAAEDDAANDVTRLAFADNASVSVVPASAEAADTALQAAVLAAIRTPETTTALPSKEPEVSVQRVNVALPVVKEAKPEVTQDVVDLRAVAGNRVNLRDGPGKDFGVVTRLSKGTSVMILEDPGDGWVQLQVVPQGSVGWMADWLLTKDG